MQQEAAAEEKLLRLIILQHKSTHAHMKLYFTRLKLPSYLLKKCVLSVSAGLSAYRLISSSGLHVVHEVSYHLLWFHTCLFPLRLSIHLKNLEWHWACLIFQKVVCFHCKSLLTTYWKKKKTLFLTARTVNIFFSLKGLGELWRRKFKLGIVIFTILLRL